MDITEIDSKLVELRDSKRVIDEEIRRLELLKSELRFGVRVGDTVTYKGKLYAIRSFYSTMWPQGLLVKADGTTGKQLKNLYDFEGNSCRKQTTK